MLIVGADPGFTGAIAFLDPHTMGITVHDMPVVAQTKGKTTINLWGLAELLDRYDTGVKIAMIEKVHAMPRQGVSSSFLFGEGYGALQMACAGHGYEMHYAVPSVWKKHFGLIFPKGATDKVVADASRGLALQRFPSLSEDLKRAKDHGRAEAALLALYAMEKLSLR